MAVLNQAALAAGGPLVGLGADVVDIERFRRVLARTPQIVDRLFTDDERSYARGRRDPVERLAVRFAAKEAVMKALGVGVGEVRFRELEVVRAPSGEPGIALHGEAADLAVRRGVGRWWLSLSHSATVAFAVAVATAAPEGAQA